MSSSVSDSEGEEVDEFELEELHLADEDERDGAAGGGSGGGGGVEAARRSNVDLRMDHLPPGQSMESTAPPRALSVVSDGRHRTGPKGVLDDYEEAKRQLRSIRMREALHRERLITTHTQGGNSDHSLRSIAADTSDPPAAKGQLSHREEEEEEGEAEGAEEDEGEEEEDDAAFNEYKAQRLAALHHSLPVFGAYRRVRGRAEFAELVKQVHEHAHVVAHLYHNSVEGCARLHLSLTHLAEVFEHVCFVRVSSEDVLPAYPRSGLPALMIYRGGLCVANAIRVVDVLPARFTDADVARLLQSQRVLSVPQGEEWQRSVHRQREQEAQRMKGRGKVRGGAAASTAEVSDDAGD